MRFEIERRFLIGNDGWRAQARPPRHLREAVLRRDDRGKLRVRIDDGTAWLAMKGPRTGFTRTENEFEIPLGAAEDLIRRADPDQFVEKARYHVPSGDAVWVVDAFRGRFRGIIWAEIELEREDQCVPLPDWVGREVTDDARFRVSNLAALTDLWDAVTALPGCAISASGEPFGTLSSRSGEAPPPRG